MKNLSIIGVMVLFISCATTVSFPISDVVPAAEITAKIKQDKHDNHVIELTAEKLADPGRLNPPKNNYSVWVITDEGRTRNVGQLADIKSRKATLTISSPFDVSEIFITAENKGNLTYPAGIEISRTTVD
jgi:hypothetical protein